VRKEFKPQRKKAEYELELRNLSILRLLRHPNIVELLGSYTYRGKHNFIFPLARGGTLADLLKCARPPAFQSDENIILALSGLCSAVHATHNLFSEDDTLTRIGCHHDLKPHNVLVDDATFLLADFGLSRFKEPTEGSATSYKYVAGCYVAPECEDFSALDETKRTQTIGRPSDIWSLGCMMMETLVYMKSGAVGVQEFENERSYRFGQITLHRFHHGPNEEEPAVAICLTDLWNNASTRSERLLIELIRQVLQLAPSARPKAEELERRMRFIAIDTIAQQIDPLYAGICGEGSSPQAFIERMQFESWMEACETLYTYKDSTLSYHWKSPSYLEYQSTLECLRELQNTLVAPLIRSQNRPNYQSIERLNDILTDALPNKLQEASRRNLELKVLGTGAQDFAGQALHHSHGHERHRISILATIKQMNSLVTERLHCSRPDLWIELRRLKGRDQVGIHHKSTLVNDENGKINEVLCEVKSYGSDRLEDSIRLQLHLRLEATAELLQQAAAGYSNGFRVLNCLGYFHDPAKLSCGLVYGLPTLTGSEHLDVSTLRTVLAEQRGPFLGSRFRLAQNLATAVLEFHQVAWLHKSVSSLNIAFVYPKGSSWGKCVDCPYLLGFSNSRPEGQDPHSTWLYETDRALMDSQHPEYLKHKGRLRYRPEFDYYSLGMVLLEIGYWKPLNKIIANIPGSPEDLLDHLRRKQVPGLGFTMGTTYRDVVDACLSGDFGKAEYVDEDSNSSTSVTLHFAKTVVEQLAKCWV
jgi:serine/threonine protein kinase